MRMTVTRFLVVFLSLELFSLTYIRPTNLLNVNDHRSFALLGPLNLATSSDPHSKGHRAPASQSEREKDSDFTFLSDLGLEIFQAVNTLRTDFGRENLTWNTVLAVSAKNFAIDMCLQRSVAHVLKYNGNSELMHSKDKSKFEDYVFKASTEVGDVFSSLAQNNVFRSGSLTADQAVGGLEELNDGRKIIRNLQVKDWKTDPPFTSFGGGCVKCRLKGKGSPEIILSPEPLETFSVSGFGDEGVFCSAIFGAPPATSTIKRIRAVFSTN